MTFINSFISFITQNRISQIEGYSDNYKKIQKDILLSHIKNSTTTEYGKIYGFKDITTVEEFQKQIPIVTYPDIKGYIDRMMNGEGFILCNEKITNFAKSSGTTDSKSKFIPVGSKSLEETHFRGAKDVVYWVNHIYPETQIFGGKTLVLGGSSDIIAHNSECRTGDLSAILISNTPFWANFLKTPDPSIMLMKEWEEKLEKICAATIDEDVRCIAGVPSWFLMLIKKLLEKRGKKNLHEIWPNLELFIHGGVSFIPYRDVYKQLLPDPKMKYIETYNASEGFFGLQNDPNDPSLLLMIDYQIFYEFIPLKELGQEHPKAIILADVDLNTNYAMVITTADGLWRYMIGDTVMFTSKKPYKFRITGRTKLFINAFGEELIIDNAIEALQKVCNKCNASVFEFTAAPKYMSNGEKGAHEWLIEFEKSPDNIEHFAELLDTELQNINSDYEAKRYKNLSLERLKINIAKDGLFNIWMKSKNKLGGQHKVPKLWNDRTHIDELLELNKTL